MRLQNIFMSDQHELRRHEKIFFFQTKRFAQQAFDAIAFDGGANTLRCSEGNASSRSIYESDIEPTASQKTPVLKNRRDLLRTTDDFVFAEAILFGADTHKLKAALAKKLAKLLWQDD